MHAPFPLDETRRNPRRAACATDQVANPALVAWVEANTSIGQVADPIGELWRWHGPAMFVALDRGALELRQGQLFWLPASGGVWIETVFARRIDPRLTTTEGRRETITSKSQYVARYRAETNRLVAPAAADPVAMRHQVLHQYGVRFSSPGAPT